MKYFSLCFLFLFINCNSEKKIISNEIILEQYIKKHDSNNQWNSAEIKLHIQEPRIKNTSRFSIVKLNNKNGSFELKRNREKLISTHIVDSKNIATTFLNDKIETDSTLIKKYRLDPKRNYGYKRFYKVLLGLPMSLKNEEFTFKNKITEVGFNKIECYKIEIELKEALFSKNWNLYFSKDDYSIIGIEMIFPDSPEKGERIIFDQIIKINKLLLPRMRHWHELDNTYSGSDIIIKEIK